jgi:hypothetical protein
VRSLAYGPYTHPQIVAELLSASKTTTCAFEVIDNAGNRADPDWLTTVKAAEINLDGDRTVSGALTLTMLPDPAMYGRFMTRRIRPWFQLLMPDGGLAQWPMGTYVWTIPRRRLTAVGQSEWTVELGDLTHLLDIGSPGLNTYYGAYGSSLRDHIVAILGLAGIPNYNVPTSITAQLGSEVAYDLAQNSSGGNRPTTLLGILIDMHAAAGCYPPWFDLNTTYRATPVPDLRTAPAVIRYVSDQNSIMEDLASDAKLQDFANRIIGTMNATGGASQPPTFYVADANDYMPDHPANQRHIGTYADFPLRSNLAFSAADLARQCEVELYQRIALHGSIALDTLPHLAHELWDVVSVAWTGDVALAPPGRRFLTRAQRFTLLGDPKQTHQLYDLVTP